MTLPAVLPHRILGDGPGVVVLIHGVGVDARSFRALAAELRRHLTVVVPDRPGYGAARRRPVGTSLGTQVDDLDRLIDVVAGRDGSCGRGGEPMVVGVSGGATLALALAIRRSARPDGRIVVVHEPLLGALAPTLADAVAAGYASTLAADAGGAERYIRELVGSSTWDRLGDDGRARVRAAGGVVAAEVPSFLAFSPSADEVRSLEGTVLVSSVGALSPPARHDASATLTELADAQEVVIDGVGHLPQVDSPAVFAGVLLDLWSSSPRPVARRAAEVSSS